MSRLVQKLVSSPLRSRHCLSRVAGDGESIDFQAWNWVPLEFDPTLFFAWDFDALAEV
jgi:hypothetical protein